MMMEESKVQLREFDVGRKLGRGKDGIVYLVRRKADQCKFALKVIFKNEMTKVDFLRQVQIHSKSQHENIIPLIAWFQDQYRYFLLMTYAKPGDLYQCIETRNMCRVAFTRRVIRAVCNALVYLHAQKIIHHDIKAENVLRGPQGRVWLTDFGYSEFSPTEEYGGTVMYMAPEITRLDPHDTSIDMWAVGVLCYEMIKGILPFPYWGSNVELFTRIQTGLYKPLEHTEAQSFISRLLVMEPGKRLTAKQALEHPFLAAEKCDSKELAIPSNALVPLFPVSTPVFP